MPDEEMLVFLLKVRDKNSLGKLFMLIDIPNYGGQRKIVADIAQRAYEKGYIDVKWPGHPTRTSFSLTLKGEAFLLRQMLGEGSEDNEPEKEDRPMKTYQTEEEFREFVLVGWPEPIVRDGRGYYVYVYKEEKGEKRLIFKEYTFISGTAQAMLNIKRAEDVGYIAPITISKARARIDLDMFEVENEYRETITSENLEKPRGELDEEKINLIILKALHNVCRADAATYKGHQLDVDGICRILNIDKKGFNYCVAYLLGKGFVARSNRAGLTPLNGGVYITSPGIDFLTSHKGLESAPEEKKNNDNIKATTGYKYDIALSFAGEDREYAERLAKALEDKGIKVFYDRNAEADLWGKDLYEHFAYVYSEAARFCVMVISKHYAEKLWSTHERRNAQERAFKEREEYILPIRIDDTKIPGIRGTVGYLSAKDKSIEEIVDIIMRKLEQ